MYVAKVLYFDEYGCSYNHIIHFLDAKSIRNNTFRVLGHSAIVRTPVKQHVTTQTAAAGGLEETAVPRCVWRPCRYGNNGNRTICMIIPI